ncbi:MAG TPA: cation-translocating P-type ATPase [Noviherbaspirillum sp.]|nr:cation-translocating P-type ATPase [Noviherbaspirillum sp.]
MHVAIYGRSPNRLMHEQSTTGLSVQEATRRLAQDGHNELPSEPRRTVGHIAFEVAREPMFMLLLAAGMIYLLLGSASDAALLLAFVLLAMSITIYQERKTERVLEALRDLSSPRALVVRDGEYVRIPGRDVVVGDLLVLEEGDRVPADGILLECHDLLIDESLLTGESVAIMKNTTNEEMRRVFSGSMVVQGGGLARVMLTGAATEIGKIGKSLQELETEKSPLQREIGILIRRFSLIGAAISLLVVILYGLSRGDWINGLLAGISLAMSVLPEEFTLILAIFMALGAWRISRSQVLTRRTPVIETLGSATVLCVDKTGTLTQNRMSVKAVVTDDGVPYIFDERKHVLPEAVGKLLQYAVLASEISPFDPMDKAFHRSLSETADQALRPFQGWSLVHEYPLTEDMLAMTHAWRSPDGTRHTVATKGAPESIARLCRLDERRTAEMLQRVQELAAQGMRVLAVAHAEHDGGEWPDGPEAFCFTWLGLVGLADPIRPAVPQAVRECREAGVAVIMITGDYPATAQAIAHEAGLRADKVMSGTELDSLSDAELRTAVRELRVFARIRPEQKLRLVQALKANGEIVAMTGDGVNDAPALKAAHIGISMGERGTDVAREASSLVLLNDDFSSIVHAIRLGRRIYDNLRKALTYVVAVHLPIAGMTILPLLFGTPLAFAPVHIVFLEMIINPACSIVFEMEHAEDDVMRRPPRAVEEKLFGAGNVTIAVLQGLGLLAAVAAVFFLGLRSGLSEAEARAGAFACVVIGNLALIVSNRSNRHAIVRLLFVPNRAQWWVLAGAAVALTLVLHTEVLQKMFHFAPVHSGVMMMVLVTAVLAIAWFESVKFFSRHVVR